MGEFFQIFSNDSDFICLYLKLREKNMLSRLDFINQNSPLEYEFLLSWICQVAELITLPWDNQVTRV